MNVFIKIEEKRHITALVRGLCRDAIVDFSLDFIENL